MLVNHFKSKGYSEPGDRLGAGRRRRQAARVAEIYRDLRAGGADRIAIVGDFNDSMDSAPLAPLLQDTDLRDISTHADFDPGPRRGTFQGGNEASKFDDVLLSPDLFGAATGGAIFRKGVWHGPRTANPWEIYDDPHRRGPRSQRPRRHLRRHRRLSYTSSMRAMSAASPWRAPSLRMRV